MSHTNENKSYMRVEKWEFASEFSKLSCPVQARTRVTWELMRVEKREFSWEFSQLSCPDQTRTRVIWELMRVDESWWKLPSERLHESFLNSHVPCKREQKLHASFLKLTGYYRSYCMRKKQQNLKLMRVSESWRSNANNSCNFRQLSPRVQYSVFKYRYNY
jgi:hypothetical protein